MLKWLDNFWYHHKWATIITAFFVVVAIICGVQLATRENYDSYFMFIGNGGSITKVQYEDIRSTLSKFSEDIDEDGKVSVCFSREVFISDFDDVAASNLNSNVTSFMQSALYQDYFVFFIDPVLYESYKDSGMFVTLESRIGSVPEEMKYDEFALRLDACKAYTLPGMSAMPKDTLVVLKTVPYFSSKKKTALAEQLQKYHADIIKNIVEYGALSEE